MSLGVPEQRNANGTPVGLYGPKWNEKWFGVPKGVEMALTDAQIKGLKPKAGARYSKADGNGLLLDVTPGGVRSWVFRYRLNGNREKVVLGRYPDLSLKAARAERDKLAARVVRGDSPAIERKLARAGMATNPTLREFGERYYSEIVVQRWKEPKHIRRYLDNEIFPTLGEKALKDVNALDVQGLVYRKRDNGQVAAAMQLRNVIKQIFDYAVERRLVTVNPAAMVATRFIGKARRRYRVLAPNEIRLYLRTVYQSNMRRQFKLALHIILLTLSRKSELLLARWKDVDLDKGEWLIPTENAKGGRPHLVYLSTQVAEMFRELKALAGESELVLPGRGSRTRPLAKNALNKALIWSNCQWLHGCGVVFVGSDQGEPQPRQNGRRFDQSDIRGSEPHGHDPSGAASD